jgi:hypothetical protein
MFATRQENRFPSDAKDSSPENFSKPTPERQKATIRGTDPTEEFADIGWGLTCAWGMSVLTRGGHKTIL